MSTRPPQHSFDKVRTAKRTAAAERASALISVTEGWLSIWDVITAAGGADGKHLLRLRLHQLLVAQEGWGPARADRVIAATVSATSPRAKHTTIEGKRGRELRLSWLLDARVGGNRVLALADAMRAPKPALPWPGFPYTPPEAALSQISGGPLP